MLGGFGTAAGAALVLPEGHAAMAPTTTAGSSMPASVASAYAWKPSLVSDFTKATSLDPKVWSQGWFPRTPTATSGPVRTVDETVAYSPANLTFDSQGLHLKLTNTPCVGGDGKTYPHTGALITSDQKVDLTPGTWVEARLKVPGAPGTTGRIYDWPSFWLDGHDEPAKPATSTTPAIPAKTWPMYGEMDIFEGSNSGASWNYHVGASATTQYNPSATVGGGVYVGWHVFALQWEAGSLTFYYDGVKIGASVTQQVTHDLHYMVVGLTSTYPGSVSSELICSSVKSWTHT